MITHLDGPVRDRVRDVSGRKFTGLTAEEVTQIQGRADYWQNPFMQARGAKFFAAGGVLMVPADDSGTAA